MKMGAMKGPKSFEVSAEFSDGCHHALSYTREAYEYMMKHCTIGAERAGKNVQDLDLAAWVVFSCGEDSATAKDAARSMVGLYASSMPEDQLRAQRRRARGDGPDHRGDRCRRHGQGHRAHHSRDRRALSIAGTPEECAEKMEREITSTGINHLILADHRQGDGQVPDGPRDRGRRRTSTPSCSSMHDKVMPAFA